MVGFDEDAVPPEDPAECHVVALADVHPVAGGEQGGTVGDLEVGDIDDLQGSGRRSGTNGGSAHWAGGVGRRSAPAMTRRGLSGIGSGRGGPWAATRDGGTAGWVRSGAWTVGWGRRGLGRVDRIEGLAGVAVSGIKAQGLLKRPNGLWGLVLAKQGGAQGIMRVG